MQPPPTLSNNKRKASLSCFSKTIDGDDAGIGDVVSSNRVRCKSSCLKTSSRTTTTTSASISVPMSY
eukprot:scaffold575_cov186-Amphora_coffeaeformis.AAC.6